MGASNWPATAPATRHLVVALAGMFLAVVVSQAFNLEPRYVAAFVAAVVLLALALGLATKVRALMLYVLAFNLALTSIEKTFLITHESTFVTSGVALGLADLTLAGLYVLWFGGVFITKEDSVPHLTTLDKWVLAFIGAHLLSALNSVSPLLTLYEVIRLVKYALMYFYLAHNLRVRHLKWIVAGVLFTIALQTAVAVVQQRTGKLMGIGRTKGASDVAYEQYAVTGFEAVRRAEGTTFDSHALGLFMAMCLGIPLALALSPSVRARWRIIAAAGLVIGLLALAVSFARAGWMAFALATLVNLACFVLWGQWRSVALACVLVVALGIPTVVPFAIQIKQRLFEAPPELVSARIETIEMAFKMWKGSPWTGCGANGYMTALEKKFSIFQGDPYFIPAHNMVVFVITELGVVGLFVFVGLSVTTIMANVRLVRSRDPLVRVLGAALLAGFVAFQVEGLTDPIYITSVTYFHVWFQLGLTGGLLRFTHTGQIHDRFGSKEILPAA